MANYFLVSFNAVPDDLSIITLPRGQVDYLSHNWQEEDVWRSWRNMTKQKNEIANGMRLENASWRTWWKQRNKLKTVTPETLNWYFDPFNLMNLTHYHLHRLKDSDVTWLYGPLHTAVDWTPPPRPKPVPTTVGNDNSASDRLDLSIPKKPILKHRSICELLTSDLPSPLFSPADSDEDDSVPRSPQDDVIDSTTGPTRRRPPLLHTKSDTHITRWGGNREVRKDSHSHNVSPDSARFSAPHSNLSLTSYFRPTSTSRSPSGSAHSNDRDNSPTGAPIVTGKKKHISFNTFVEQCIAIEKPKKLDPFDPYVNHASFLVPSTHPLSYNSYVEDDISLPVRRDPPFVDSDSDGEDDDDVLEMRTSSTFIPKLHSPSKASSSSSSSVSSSEAARYRPPLIRTNSVERERVTIASIAPTILKTTDVSDDEDGWPGSLAFDSHDAAAVHERERIDSATTPVELVYVPPLGSNYEIQREDGESEDAYHDRELIFNFGGPVSLVYITYSLESTSFLSFGIQRHTSPEKEDLSGSPDLGDDSKRRRLYLNVEDDDLRGHAQTPEVVLNDGTGKPEVKRCSRSRSNSRSRTPSPASLVTSSPESSSLPIPHPRGRSASYSPPALLSPPTRGRSHALSRSSSATQLGTETESQPRGRSSARTSSSVSERERSSRGSISPDALGAAVGGGRMVYGTVRGDRERSGGRGRERTERRLSGSLSSDFLVDGQRSDAASFSSMAKSTPTSFPPKKAKPGTSASTPAP